MAKCLKIQNRWNQGKRGKLLYYCRTQSEYIILQANPAFSFFIGKELEQGQNLEEILDDTPYCDLIPHTYALTTGNFRTSVEIQSIQFDIEGYFDTQGDLIEYQFIGYEGPRKPVGSHLVEKAFDVWFRQLPFPSFVLSQSMMIEQVNEAFCLLLDYRKEEIEHHGSFLDIFLSMEHRTRALEYLKLRSLSPDAPPLRFEAVISTRTGDNLDVVVYILASPHSVWSVVSLVDITIQKLNESYSRPGEDKFYKIFHENPEPILITTPGSPKIVDGNRVFCTRIGRSSDEIKGRGFEDIGFSFKDSERKRILDALSEKNTGSTLLEGTDAAGEKVFYKMSVERITLDGNMFWIWMGRDMTMIKQYEKKIIQAELRNSLGTLAGGIAHDFNNLLAVILGYSELAVPFVAQNEQLKFYFNEILDAGHRAEQLVKQIMLLGAPDEGNKEVLNLSLLVSEYMATVKKRLNPEIRLLEEYTETAWIKADLSLVHQIIRQLLSNAVFAVSHTKEPLISLSTISLSSEKEIPGILQTGSYICFRIIDNGVGINDSVIDHIFEPYFSTRSKVDGSGLGLAIVKSVVLGMGGEIIVDSRPGEGSAFSVYFPAESEIKPHTMHTSVKLVKSAGGTGKILLVDDEPAVLNMLKQLLERGGYEVVACGCSTDALELFQRDSCFDLVITDQTMPGLTGSQLAGRLLTIKPEIPIILCTGYSETIDSAKAGLLGIRKFLMKPVIGQVLLSNVHSVLQNHI